MSDKKFKDPNATAVFFVVWCSKDGTNDGSATDTGFLQGATISDSTWTLADGLEEDSSNTSARTIRGVVYAVNTVAAVVVTGGTAGTVYSARNRMTASDGRIQDKTIYIEAVEQ